MARNPSAMKYKRQSDVTRLMNRSRKSTIRTFTKKALAAAEQGNQEEALEYQRQVVSLIDKAAANSTFHKKTASRKKSRLMKNMNKIMAGA